MFTGIITAIARITQVQALGESAAHGKQLTLHTPPGYLDDVALGDSIALNGACMTVIAFDASACTFQVDISAESLDKTAGLNAPGSVNLEKALRAHDRLGGHVVSGHVDGIAEVLSLEPVGESWLFSILAPKSLAQFLAYKGSITLNGASLTINRVCDSEQGCEVDINLIPHTVQNTTLGQLRPGAKVNVEIDLMARYVERMLSLKATH